MRMPLHWLGIKRSSTATPVPQMMISYDLNLPPPAWHKEAYLLNPIIKEGLYQFITCIDLGMVGMWEIGHWILHSLRRL